LDAHGLNCPTERRSDSMFSIWWLLAAFLLGTYAGIFLLALMHVCGDVRGDSEHERHARQAAG